MTTKRTYIIKDLKSGKTKEVQAQNINNLRKYLIQSGYSWNARILVSSKTGSILGEYHQGMNGGYWLTPKGTTYELFRDGSFRGEY